jgi:hypothetical protein
MESDRMESAETTTNWVRIVQSEFIEMPCLLLTRSQVRRLWGLDDAMCTRVLDALVRDKFLKVTSDGRYARTTAAERSLQVAAVNEAVVPRSAVVGRARAAGSPRRH